MKRYVSILIYLFFVIFTCYLYTMQACNRSFYFMAREKQEFSLWTLTLRTWSDGLWYGFTSLSHFIYYPFSANIYILAIVFVPFFAGFAKWWKNPYIWLYMPPFLWLLFWDYVFMNQPITGQYGILDYLREFPGYYHQLPAWFQFLLDHFPAFGSWR